MKDIPKRILEQLYGDDCLTAAPTTLNVEVTNICNLRCVMCPTWEAKRDRGFMDLRLFEDVLEEAVEMGITQVGLHTVGESVLHKDIHRFIHLAKEKGCYTYMDINGNRLSEGTAIAIVDNGLDSLKFSIDGHDNETYRKIRRGGDFNKVLQNLQLMDRIRKENNSSMRLYALYIIMKNNDSHIDDFKRKLGPFVDEIEFTTVVNQGEQVKECHSMVSDKVRDIVECHRRKSVCSNPWKRITLSWDGYLTACCIDFELNLVYGKYRKGNLSELWNNDRINYIRERLLNHEGAGIPLCENCDLTHFDYANIVKDINERF